MGSRFVSQGVKDGNCSDCSDCSDRFFSFRYCRVALDSSFSMEYSLLNQFSVILWRSNMVDDVKSREDKGMFVLGQRALNGDATTYNIARYLS